MATLEIPTEFLEGMKWIQTHREKLQDSYEGRWIAVYQNQVIVSGLNFKEVQQEAVKKTGQPVNHLAIVFVDDPRCIYLSLL